MMIWDIVQLKLLWQRLEGEFGVQEEGKLFVELVMDVEIVKKLEWLLPKWENCPNQGCLKNLLFGLIFRVMPLDLFSIVILRIQMILQQSVG